LDLLEKRFGSAGDGYQYHHIVTQGGANAGNILAEQLQTPTTSFAFQRCCMSGDWGILGQIAR